MSALHVETLQLPHLPTYPVHVALVKNVTNASSLRQHLLEANPDFEYAFLDATSVLSTTHLLAAIFRAINDLHHGRLKSRNVHSEIVFCFSPNNNIADSFRRFGLTDNTTSLLAVKLGLPSQPGLISAESISAHLSANVSGESVPFSDVALAELADLQKIKKIYKISELDGGSTGKRGKKGDGKRKRENQVNGTGAMELDGAGTDDLSGEAERNHIESVIVGMMALRGS